jgi:hypothetical protein
MAQGRIAVVETSLALFYDDWSGHFFRDAIMRVAA